MWDIQGMGLRNDEERGNDVEIKEDGRRKAKPDEV